jgi:hypothetical protein
VIYWSKDKKGEIKDGFQASGLGNKVDVAIYLE